MKALLKASALALFLLATAACSDAPTVAAPPQASGLVEKAGAALEGRQARIAAALEEAGA